MRALSCMSWTSLIRLFIFNLLQNYLKLHQRFLCGFFMVFIVHTYKADISYVDYIHI